MYRLMALLYNCAECFCKPVSILNSNWLHWKRRALGASWKTDLACSSVSSADMHSVYKHHSAHWQNTATAERRKQAARGWEDQLFQCSRHQIPLLAFLWIVWSWTSHRTSQARSSLFLSQGMKLNMLKVMRWSDTMAVGTAWVWMISSCTSQVIIAAYNISFLGSMIPSILSAGPVPVLPIRSHQPSPPSWRLEHKAVSEKPLRSKAMFLDLLSSAK